MVSEIPLRFTLPTIRAAGDVNDAIMLLLFLLLENIVAYLRYLGT